MTRSAQPYLALIQRALTQIERYRPPTKGEFLAQQMVQDAILMRLQEIGENLSRIRRLDEEAFNCRSPESWHHLIGLRNIISHGYHAVDPDEIWQILTEELPAFRLTIERANTDSGLPTE